MFLQVLRTLEGLATEVTFVRLQRDMDTDVRGDMVTLDGGGAAGIPPTGQIQVVCALSSDVLLTDMVLGARLDRDRERVFSGCRLNIQKEPQRKCIVRSTCPTGRPGCRQRQCSVGLSRPRERQWAPRLAAVAGPVRGPTL